MDKTLKKNINSDFSEIIDKYIEKGITTDLLFNEFSLIISKLEKKKNKTKKKTKKACRPVLFISDSSCDEIKELKIDNL